MAKLVSITRQGQLTIPESVRKEFGIKEATKALVHKEGNIIIVEPKTDFWSLSGSLRSSVSLSDKELRKARATFEKKWSRKQ